MKSKKTFIAAICSIVLITILTIGGYLYNPDNIHKSPPSSKDPSQKYEDYLCTNIANELKEGLNLDSASISIEKLDAGNNIEVTFTYSNEVALTQDDSDNVIKYIQTSLSKYNSVVVNIKN